MLSALNADPSWLNSGDTAWQLTSATLVGIMSIPGLAILYAGLMKRKFAVNSALMVVYAFAMTLVIWMFFAYDMSFGSPLHIGGAATTFVGIPHPVAGASDLEQQASIPLLSGLIPALRFPMSSLVYFQFVFATITVIILGGALLGRISFKAWALFVPLWITLVYSVGAFSLWGGGWLGCPRRSRLQRWLRHPRGCGSVGVRRGRGHRSARAEGPQEQHAQQHHDGGRGRWTPLARLERVQRW